MVLEVLYSIAARKGFVLGPALRIRRPAQLPDLVQLVEVRGSGKYRFPEEHLTQHAAEMSVKVRYLPRPRGSADKDLPDTPQIHFAAILPRTKQKLGRTVPPRDDTIRVLPFPTSRIFLHPNNTRIERTGQTEVCNLQTSVVRDEQVRRFHISMQNVVLQKL